MIRITMLIVFFGFFCALIGIAQEKAAQIALEYYFYRWDPLESGTHAEGVPEPNNKQVEEAFSVDVRLTNNGKEAIALPVASMGPIMEWREEGGKLFLHFSVSMQRMKNGGFNVPSKWQFWPVELQPGESTIIRYRWKDHSLRGKRFSVNVTYFVDAALADRFGFWKGKLIGIQSPKGF
jgi:hypothetical protein